MGGSTHFSASLPLLALVKNVSLVNPYLDLACAGGGFTLWLNRQGMVEVSICGGADASLLAQQLDGHLVLADSLQTAARVRLAAIPSADEELRELSTFAFVASHLFSTGRRHSYTVTEILRLITRLEELHTEVQGMISPPHLVMTLLFDFSRRWSLYLNRCVDVSAS